MTVAKSTIKRNRVLIPPPWATCINKLLLVARVTITHPAKNTTGNKDVGAR